MIRGVILGIFILIQAALFAQSDIAQLKMALQEADGEKKVQILNQLADLHLDRSPDMVNYYADQALSETRVLEDRFMNEIGNEDLHVPNIIRYQAEAYLLKGQAFEKKGDTKKAIQFYKTARRKAGTVNINEISAAATEHLKRNGKGGEIGKQILSELKEPAIKVLEDFVLNTQINPEIIDATAKVIAPIAENSKNKGQHNKAIEYFEMLLKYEKNSDELAKTHNNLSELYAATNQPEKAQKHHKAALEYASQANAATPPSTPEPPAPKSEDLRKDIQALVEGAETMTTPKIEQEEQVRKENKSLLSNAERHAKQGNYQKSYEELRQYAIRQELIHQLKFQRQEDSLLLSTQLAKIDQLMLEQAIQKSESEKFLSTRKWLFFSLGLILLILALLTALFFNKRKAHSKMKQAYDQLADTHIKLKSAQTQLVSSEKMASLGQLTAGIAHEINNPVNFISGNITPLKHDVKDLLTILNAYEQAIDQEHLMEKFHSVKQLREELEIDYVTEEIEELLDGIDEGANRTTEIVKGLRTFARLDDGDWKRFDLHHGLDSTLALLKNRLNNIEILKDYHSIPEIEGYPGKLNQVFMNLLNNAVQAMPDGGLIHLITFPYPDEIEIRIRDTGKGIPKEVRNRIFEPFFTTKEIGEGTGLGLSISHGIIQQHGGSIEIESFEGQGTEVVIRLPIMQKISDQGQSIS
ncbi:MAG: ATP-binding protein [Bacteroidota bacterium]